MAAQRKKDGGPNIKFFESPETVAQFDSVRTWLQKNYKKVTELNAEFNNAIQQLGCG